MKNDANNTTEKLGVSKDEASSSDNKENKKKKGNKKNAKRNKEWRNVYV